MNEQELEQIEKRADAATPGPMTEQIVELSWSTEDEPQYGYWVNDADGDIFAHVWSEDDMKFVSHSRQDIPALLDEVERLKLELSEMTEDRDNENRWAKEYFDRWEVSRDDVERLKSQLAEAAAPSDAEIIADNDKLREALEFYANPDNYIVVDFLVGSGSEISIDKGEIAREALEGGEE